VCANFHNAPNTCGSINFNDFPIQTNPYSCNVLNPPNFIKVKYEGEYGTRTELEHINDKYGTFNTPNLIEVKY
jgi:hypothetical protein